MSFDPVAARGATPTPLPPVQPSQKVTAKDSDGDNEAAEKKAAKADEASKSSDTTLPADPNKGRNVNISA